ncbi:DUF1365 domain-containing protein [Luteipulveratus mongoliensis]|uniref:DUF1365 domain-containing protein n=1 Tax=Luteipulveratus mongoliensis TaxID=571913 RepID=UPI000698AA4D|nr:DUF1365 domain-containing protein [Luteipulveratus mongoliensis]
MRHRPAQLLLTEVRHTRTSPIRHDFTYASCSWLIDLDALGARRTPAGIPWWIRAFVSFEAGDHVGDPSRSWRENVDQLAHEHGVDLVGGRVLALAGARSLGHVFNPLTLYWCWDRGGQLACVIAEVHNTYGGRHAYVVRPDQREVANVEKALYVSPFNDTRGSYTMSVPVPRDRLDVRITLHAPDQRPFVATWRGRPVESGVDLLRAALRVPLASHAMSARIRLQGIRLWLRGLPVIPRPAHSRQEAA